MTRIDLAPSRMADQIVNELRVSKVKIQVLEELIAAIKQLEI